MQHDFARDPQCAAAEVAGTERRLFQRNTKQRRPPHRMYHCTFGLTTSEVQGMNDRVTSPPLGYMVRVGDRWSAGFLAHWPWERSMQMKEQWLLQWPFYVYPETLCHFAIVPTNARLSPFNV